MSGASFAPQACLSGPRLCDLGVGMSRHICLSVREQVEHTCGGGGPAGLSTEVIGTGGQLLHTKLSPATCVLHFHITAGSKWGVPLPNSWR